MKFGPDGGTNKGSTAPTQTLSPAQAMMSLSQASGIPYATVQAIQLGWGMTPSEILTQIPNLGAEYQANPGADPGTIGSSVLGGTPAQITLANTVQSGQQSATGHIGGFTAIAGDVFEAVYPFFMFTLGAVAFLGFLLISVIAISKSPTGKSVLSGATSGASAGFTFAKTAGAAAA